MFIRSERLFLRPGWPEDWQELLTLINDETVVKNLATVPWPLTMDDALAFARRPQDRMLPHFFITLPGGDGARLIGSVGLGRLGDEVELGYWIARQYRGRGYAPEAARSVLRLAAALGHTRITANHFADNFASGRVLLKAGFRPAGETRLRHSIDRGDEAPTVSYVIELDAHNDCDEGGDMRAA
jgi:RimJ/RimL family protein N-acetyltransferase